MSRKCMFLDSLSRHNKDLEWRTLKPPRRVTALGSWIDCVIALGLRKTMLYLSDKSVLQLSVIALFYFKNSRKIHLRGVRARRSKDMRRAPQRAGERESWLWLLYLYVSLFLGLSYVNWASQECCLFYLRSSLWSSDLLLFHFHRLFPSFSVATTILDSFSLFYLPNTNHQNIGFFGVELT